MKIGILTCANCTKELNCGSAGCLRDMYARKGFFQRYPAEDALEIAGINQCSGCPTISGHGRILRQIQPLVEAGAEVLHVAYCITAICPFQAVYEKKIQEAYPDLEVVWGTHEPIDVTKFRQVVSDILCAPQEKLSQLRQRQNVNTEEK